MTRLILIRHAPTPWNREKRLQGRTDVALDKAGEAWVKTWRLPPEAKGVPVVASPLSRAWRTAALLIHDRPAIDPRLIEMSYGTWEGERLPDLRQRLGAEMAAMEARGWDFSAPGGESPRTVLARLMPWVKEVAAQGSDTLAVCHNGVIRALIGAATGWDFTGKPPAKLKDGTAHYLTLSPDGAMEVERVNHPLSDEAAPDG